jgi:hypothetical protein
MRLRTAVSLMPSVRAASATETQSGCELVSLTFCTGVAKVQNLIVAHDNDARNGPGHGA